MSYDVVIQLLGGGRWKQLDAPPDDNAALTC